MGDQSPPGGMLPDAALVDGILRVDASESNSPAPLDRHTLHLTRLAHDHYMWISRSEDWNWLQYDVSETPFEGVDIRKNCTGEVDPMLMYAVDRLVQQLHRLVPDDAGASPMQGTRSNPVPLSVISSMYHELLNNTRISVDSFTVSKSTTHSVRIDRSETDTQWAVVCAPEELVVSLVPSESFYEHGDGGVGVITLYAKPFSFLVFRLPTWTRALYFGRASPFDVNATVVLFRRNRDTTLSIVRAAASSSAAPDVAASASKPVAVIRRCESSIMCGFRETMSLMTLAKKAQHSQLDFSTSLTPPAGISRDWMAFAYYLGVRVNGDMLNKTAEQLIGIIGNRLMIMDSDEKVAAQSKRKQGPDSTAADALKKILTPMMPHKVLVGAHLEMGSLVVLNTRAPLKSISLLAVHHLMSRFAVYMAHAVCAGLMLEERIRDEIVDKGLRDAAEILSTRICVPVGISVEVGKAVFRSDVAAVAEAVSVCDLAAKLAHPFPAVAIQLPTQRLCVNAYVAFAIHTVLVALVAICPTGPQSAKHMDSLCDLIRPSTARTTHDTLYPTSDYARQEKEHGDATRSFKTHAAFQAVVGLLERRAPNCVVAALRGINAATADRNTRNLEAEPDPKLRKRAVSGEPKEPKEPKRQRTETSTTTAAAAKNAPAIAGNGSPSYSVEEPASDAPGRSSNSTARPSGKQLLLNRPPALKSVPPPRPVTLDDSEDDKSDDDESDVDD